MVLPVYEVIHNNLESGYVLYRYITSNASFNTPRNKLSSIPTIGKSHNWMPVIKILDDLIAFKPSYTNI